MSIVNGHMSKVNFVFFGTPEPAVEILDALLSAGYVPALIVTNPDRPQGRKMAITPPPVKVWALEHNIPFIQPKSLRDPEVLGQLSKVNGQLFIIVAYGKLLPQEILALPKHGSLNVHYSLLPKYRGASPIESQILADDRNVGVSILLLDGKMDHGPIVAQEHLQRTTYNVQPSWPPTATELRKAFTIVAGKLLIEILPKWVAGEMKAVPQNHAEATYTRKFTKEDGLINPDDNDCPDETERRKRAYENFLKIQAFEGSIGTHFYRNNGKMRVRIKSAKFKDGILSITRVVPEGKKEMDYAEFARGLK